MAKSATAISYNFFSKEHPVVPNSSIMMQKVKHLKTKTQFFFTFSFIFFCGKTSEQSATNNMNAGVVRNGSKSVAKNRTSTKMKVTLKIEEQEEMRPIKNNPELKEV